MEKVLEKFDSIEAKLEAKIEASSNTQIKWIIAVMFALGGLILAILKY